jgi:PAS domain S-box-containing protein
MIFYGMGNESAMIEDAIEAADMAWWIMELPSGAVFFSPNKIKLLGYDEKETSDFVHYTAFTNLLHPDDHDNTMKAMEDHLSGKVPIYQSTYRIKTKSGDYKTLYDRGKIIARQGDDLALAGIVIDFTNYRPAKRD